MTRARRELIALEATSYYHCISRCVRRAFLWGVDSLTGKNYEHRKAWVVERLGELAEIFAIEIGAYAVMSNHYHLVLRIDKDKALGWHPMQIIDRWERLFSLPVLISRYQRGEAQSEAEIQAAVALIEQWRARLMDISWFMRALNESLARHANREDGCSGRFWEGRFKSQALLDEAAVLTCMSYVDLNPVRAGVAETPETSEFTSIAQRIRQHGPSVEAGAQTAPVPPAPALMVLGNPGRDPHPNAIDFTTRDYLELVDWAARVVRQDKRGYIPEHVPSILSRLGLEPAGYLAHVKGGRHRAHPLVLGTVQHIRCVAKRLNRRFLKGLGEARLLYFIEPA